MVMHAKLESSLREGGLRDDADFDSEQSRVHGVARDGDFMLFDGLRRKPRLFIRHSGLDLSTGDLFVGDVQFDKSVTDVVSGFCEGGHFSSRTDMEDGRALRTPLAFELERYFDQGAGDLKVVEMYADGFRMEGFAVEQQKSALAEWRELYSVALERSLIGKPMMESDFAARNFSGRKRKLTPRESHLLYGVKIYEELKRLSPSNLIQCYS